MRDTYFVTIFEPPYPPVDVNGGRAWDRRDPAYCRHNNDPVLGVHSAQEHVVGIYASSGKDDTYQSGEDRGRVKMARQVVV